MAPGAPAAWGTAAGGATARAPGRATAGADPSRAEAPAGAAPRVAAVPPARATPAPGNPGGGNMGPGNMGPISTGEVFPAPAGHTPLRRLTRSQYNNTIHDLLGIIGDPAGEFGVDEEDGGFASNSRAPLKELQLEKYQQAAETLADKAVANLGNLLKCAPGGRRGGLRRASSSAASASAPTAGR